MAPHARRVPLGSTHQRASAYNAMPGINQVATTHHVKVVHLTVTHFGTALMARNAYDAKLGSNPTHNAQVVMLAWVSTRLMVVSAWIVWMGRNHLMRQAQPGVSHAQTPDRAMCLLPGVHARRVA